MCTPGIKNKFKVTKGEVGVNWEIGIDIYILLYIKQINKDLLYNIGNYMQHLIINYNGKNTK